MSKLGYSASGYFFAFFHFSHSSLRVHSPTPIITVDRKLNVWLTRKTWKNSFSSHANDTVNVSLELMILLSGGSSPSLKLRLRLNKSHDKCHERGFVELSSRYKPFIALYCSSISVGQVWRSLIQRLCYKLRVLWRWDEIWSTVSHLSQESSLQVSMIKLNLVSTVAKSGFE